MLRPRAELRTFEEAKGNQLISVGFSPDGKHVLATSSTDKREDLGGRNRQTRSRSNITRTERPTLRPYRDGKTLATGGTDGSIMLWDAASGKAIATVSAGTGPRSLNRLQPGRKTFCRRASGRTAKIFDTKSRKELFSMTPRRRHLRHFIQPGRQTARLRRTDQTVKLWDTGTGETVSLPFRSTNRYMAPILAPMAHGFLYCRSITESTFLIRCATNTNLTSMCAPGPFTDLFGR